MAMSDKLYVTVNREETKIFDLEKEKEKILFSMTDTSHLRISFHTEKNSSLSMQCYQALNENTKKRMSIEKDTLTLESDVTYKVSGGNEYYYLPGIYSFSYESKTAKKTFYFEVKNISVLGKDGFDNIISRLEDILKNITRELSREGDVDSLEQSYPLLTHRLEENLLSFKNLERRMLSSLKEEVVTVYGYFPAGREDYKTFRRNITHPFSEKLTKKKGLSFDSKENQLLKYRMNAFKRKVSFLLNSLKEKETRNHLSLYKANEEYEKLTKRREEHLYMDVRLSKQDIVLQKKMNELQEERQGLHSLIDILMKYNHVCDAFLQDDRIKKITLLSTPSYLSSSPMAKEIREMQKKIFPDKEKVSYKPARELFELYGYYLIHTALMELGYQKVSQLGSSFLKENETSFVYESETRMVKVLYGPFCKDFLTNKEMDCTVSINSQHRSPDFIMEVYDIETNMFLFDLILEIKYIPIFKFNAKEDLKKDILLTASDYLQFGFVSKEGLRVGAVRKVMILFPALNEKVEDYLSFHKIYLLGIDMNKDTCESVVYTFLKEELSKETE